MRIGSLVLCAAMLALSVTSASATMLIAGDRGGQIGRYLQTFAQVRSSGERVVIEDGATIKSFCYMEKSRIGPGATLVVMTPPCPPLRSGSSRPPR